MTNRSKMILGLASLLGVTAGATAVSGFAWFVTTKTATVDVTNIGIYNNNPSLSVDIINTKGVVKTNNAANDFNLMAANDSSDFLETKTGDGTETEFILTGTPIAQPTAYVNGVATAITWDSANNKATFATAPADGAEIRFVYCDKAALTDVSSIDGINVYDPTWEVASEGRNATIIRDADEGEQYITFDMKFTAPTTGALKVFLDRPTITALDGTDDSDKEAADVARVGFSTAADGNVLTISNKVSSGYEKGISQDKVEDYDDFGTTNANTTAGHYEISHVTDNCQHLVVPSTTNYSVLSAAPDTTAANNYLCTINGSDVTVHVCIWLEGTSHVDGEGNNSLPIGGEISVSLPIVAFGA